MSPLVCAREKRADDKITPGIVQLRPDDVTRIVGFRGSWSDNLKKEVNNAIYGFDAPQDTITWTGRSAQGHSGETDEQSLATRGDQDHEEWKIIRTLK